LFFTHRHLLPRGWKEDITSVRPLVGFHNLAYLGTLTKKKKKLGRVVVVKLDVFHVKMEKERERSLAPVAHACNPSYMSKKKILDMGFKNVCCVPEFPDTWSCQPSGMGMEKGLVRTPRPCPEDLHCGLWCTEP
jgi:hypothetical protein